MTYETANLHMHSIYDGIKRTCRNYREAKRYVERYADKHNLKCKDGEPTVIYEPGSERVILLSRNAYGGIHMDIAVSPVYALLDQVSQTIIIG